MGTISIRVCRVVVTGASVPKTVYTPAPGSAVLHERSKKAQLSHQTGLGAAVAAAPATTSAVDWLEKPENPMLSLELAYRSRTLLELNDIIPGAPAPNSISAERSADLFCLSRGRAPPCS